MTNLKKEPRRPRSRQLISVNERISEFADARPENRVYGVFALAARMAHQATKTTLGLRNVSGADAREFEAVLDFWARLSDYAGAAALNCVGGNQTLTEALVTHEFLWRAERNETDAD